MANEQRQDVGDEDQVRERKQTQRLKRINELDDIRAVLSTPQGRRVVWRILGMTHLYKESFTGNSTTFYNEGQRSIGLQLLGELTAADPLAYVKLQQENADDDRS
jgi:hypothetical protein